MLNIQQAQEFTDEEIVKLTLGNQDYFLLIINRYKGKLFNFIRRLTNLRDEDCEDLLQDVFLKVYLNLNDFDHDYKFSTWVYAITRNQVISNHRKRQVRPEGHAVTMDDDNVARLASDFNIQKTMDAAMLRETVLGILDSIDRKYREVLVLKYLEEKSYKEISDIIKKNSGTVSSMLYRAKEAFKHELEKRNKPI